MRAVSRMAALVCLVLLAGLLPGEADRHAVAVKPSPGPSTVHIPLGLQGAVAGEVLVAPLRDGDGPHIFVPTSSGLYIITETGEIDGFIYSPFVVRQVSLLDDMTGDGVREILVLLNDPLVPVLRCYSGADGSELWHFATDERLFVDGLGWADVQATIDDMQVIEQGDRQTVALLGDKTLFVVDARNGELEWSFQSTYHLAGLAAVTSRQDPGRQDIVVGSDDGYIYLLDGRSGKIKLRHLLDKHEQTSTDHYDGRVYVWEQQACLQDTATVDRAAGLVALSTSAGQVVLFDFHKGMPVWEKQVVDADAHVCVSALPGGGDAGVPSILVTILSWETWEYSGDPVTRRVPMTVLDGEGSSLWSGEVVSQAGSVQVHYAAGRAMMVDRDSQEIRLLDINDGALVDSIQAGMLDGFPPRVKSLGEEALVLVNCGSDLRAVGMSGEDLWHVPRVDRVSVVDGPGDPGTRSVLLCGEVYRRASGSHLVRLLALWDEAAGEMVWTYEVEPGDVAGGAGLEGVTILPGPEGGGRPQTVLAYQGSSLLLLDGATGEAERLELGDYIQSIQPLEGGHIAVALPGFLVVVDPQGAEVWRGDRQDWGLEGSVEIGLLDDINGDGVADLLLAAPSRLVVLRSTSPAGFEKHLDFEPEEGLRFGFTGVMADAGGIMINIACVEEDAGQYYYPWQRTCPVLVVRSALSGEEIYRATMPGHDPVLHPGCADFNGDGVPDMVVTTARSCNLMLYGDHLQAFSGLDGTPLTGPLSFSGDTWTVCSLDGGGTGLLYLETDYDGYNGRLVMYDVAAGGVRREIDLAYWEWMREWPRGIVEIGSLSGNGDPALLAAWSEPLYAAWPPRSLEIWSLPSLTVLDPETGTKLVSFLTGPGFRLDESLILGGTGPGLIGLAGLGGLYFFDTRDALEITSPLPDSTSRGNVRVSWEGTRPGETVFLFLDGALVQVARGRECSIAPPAGSHVLRLVSVDEFGRVRMAEIDFHASHTLWSTLLIIGTMAGMAGVLLLLLLPRLDRRRNRRLAAAGAALSPEAIEDEAGLRERVAR